MWRMCGGYVKRRKKSASERGRVKEVRVCSKTEILIGLWLGVLMGVVYKEGVTGWEEVVSNTCKDFCEDE